MDNIVTHEQFLGNRCGHRPNAPRWYERPAQNAQTYDVIHQAIQSLKLFYLMPHDYLLNLHGESRTSARQIRSDRREAIMSLSQVLADHVDLATREVVWLRQPKQKGGGSPQELQAYVESLKYPRVPMTIKMLAQKAGISQSRCELALRDLKRAGYIEIEPKCTLDEETNKIIPKPAVKRLNMTFFLHLGITLDKIRSCVTEAKRRLKARTKKELMMQRTAQASVDIIVDQLKSLSNRGRRKRDQSPQKPFGAAPPEVPMNEWGDDKWKRYNEIIDKLRQYQPDTPDHEAKKFALQQMSNYSKRP